jgi:hypothetical protein
MAISLRITAAAVPMHCFLRACALVGPGTACSWPCGTLTLGTVQREDDPDCQPVLVAPATE